MSIRSRLVALVALLTVVMLVVISCAAAPARQAAQAPAPTAAPAAQAAPAVVVTQVVERQVEVPAAPRPQEAPAAGSADSPLPAPGGSPSNRKIIKDGELNLVVDDLVRAVDRVTKIAADTGGYILSNELSTEGAVKRATVKLGVPSEAFEDVLRQLRGIALTVKWERASGTDVTSEYVDLQSQLTNLQATQARLRQFLDQAKTVEEALKVNAELSRIEGEIETIQGRLQYLSNRAAYSTITLYVEQIAPTPTVTPTPSITPTPTATPTATPIVWRPNETFSSARITLQYVLRGLGDVAVWGGVLCIPLALIAAIILAPIVWLRRRARRRRTQLPPPAPPSAPPPADNAA
jgi:hypothetical protein